MISWLRRHPIISSFATICVVGPVLLVLWVAWQLQRPPRIAPEAFAPDASAAQIEVHDFATSVEDFARSRGERDAISLVRTTLEAFGEWPLEEDESSAASQVRVRAALEGADQILGERAIIFAGEWNCSDGSVAPAVVAVTRTDTLLKWRAGTLARVVLGKDAVTRERQHGVSIYARAVDEDHSRHVSMLTIGGWLVVVIEPENGAAAAEIAHRAMSAPVSNKGESTGFESAPFVRARVHPDILPRLEAAFGLTKAKKKKDKPSSAERFAEAMDGVQHVEVRIENAFGLTLTASGNRILNDPMLFAQLEPSPVAELEDPTTSAARLSPPILQMDFASSFARGGADTLGLDWDEIMEESRDFDWVRPELLDAFASMLKAGDGADANHSAGGRMGFAFYPTLAETIPVAAVWEDRGHVRRFNASPADAWRMIEMNDLSVADSETSDSFALLGMTYYKSALEDRALEEKREFADGFWREGSAPPLAFIVVNFDELVESMLAFPAILLDDKDQERWIEWRERAEGLRRTIGSLAVRVDRGPDALKIEVRTPNPQPTE